jgi:hypothetical protein
MALIVLLTKMEYSKKYHFFNLKVYAIDLKRFDGITYQTDSLTNFICNIETSNIEAIFIRSILNEFEYEIIKEIDFSYDGIDIKHIEIKTNLPSKKYRKKRHY